MEEKRDWEITKADKPGDIIRKVWEEGARLREEQGYVQRVIANGEPDVASPRRMETRTFYRIEGTECVPVEFVVRKDGLVGKPNHYLGGWHWLKSYEEVKSEGYAETPEGAWELAIAAAKEKWERLFEDSERAKSRYLELVDASVDSNERWKIRYDSSQEEVSASEG